MAKRKTDAAPAAGAASKKSRLDVVQQANLLDGREWAMRTEKISPSHMGRGLAFRTTLVRATELDAEDVGKCFGLIETTSRRDYESSGFGWHPKRKLREMKQREMRYLMLYRRASEPAGCGGGWAGFMSFMCTHDSTPAVPVLYVYEIHLVEEARGHGLGKELMRRAEAIARELGMQKVMLTCLKSNAHAHTFYQSLGYQADVCSPKDVQTRRKISPSDYVIMSRDLERSPPSLQAVGDAGANEDAQVKAGRDEAPSATAADMLPSVSVPSRGDLDIEGHR